MQKLVEKVQSLESRIIKMEKERGLGFVRLSDMEMKEIRKAKKEMESGREHSFEEVFGK